jgi:hypothetical protein
MRGRREGGREGGEEGSLDELSCYRADRFYSHHFFPPSLPPSLPPSGPPTPPQYRSEPAARLSSACSPGEEEVSPDTLPPSLSPPPRSVLPLRLSALQLTQNLPPSLPPSLPSRLLRREPVSERNGHRAKALLPPHPLLHRPHPHPLPPWYVDEEDRG